MASPIDKVTASIRFDNARVVEWSLKSGYNYPKDFKLSVQVSRSGDSWETLTENAKDSCVFVDTRRRNYGKWMHEFYRIRLESDGEVYVSDPVMAGTKYSWPFSEEAENAVKQISKQIEITGVPGVLLKRKYFGPRCPRCTDFAGQATVNEHCPRCLGTGIDGGYFPGISLSIVKDQIQRQETETPAGKATNEEVAGRCIAYPWIKTGDIWCEGGTNNRYVVTRCTPSATYKTTDLVYTLTLSRKGYAEVVHTPEADALVSGKDSWNKPAPSVYAKPSIERKPPIAWTAVLKKDDAGNN